MQVFPKIEGNTFKKDMSHVNCWSKGPEQNKKTVSQGMDSAMSNYILTQCSEMKNQKNIKTQFFTVNFVTHKTVSNQTQ